MHLLVYELYIDIKMHGTTIKKVTTEEGFLPRDAKSFGEKLPASRSTVLRSSYPRTWEFLTLMVKTVQSELFQSFNP